MHDFNVISLTTQIQLPYLYDNMNVCAGELLVLTSVPLFSSPRSRVMSSKPATSPFASVVDGDDAMSQDNLSWEKEESAEAHGTPQLPLHSLLHGKAQHEEMQQLSSIPPESEWDSLVSAQQRMVRHDDTGPAQVPQRHCFHFISRSW